MRDEPDSEILNCRHRLQMKEESRAMLASMGCRTTSTPTQSAA